MRRFKSTPQKKLLGMAILFVLVPLFLIWYWVFFLDNKPGTDTAIIIAAGAALLFYIYLGYKRRLAAQARQPETGEEEFPEEGEEFEEGFDEEEPEEFEEETPKKAAKPFKQKKQK